MKDLKALSRDIAPLVGGPSNVSWLGSCTTRLRFVVRDESQVDFPALNELPGVIQAIKAGGQVQVVIGTQVDQVRDALLEIPEWKSLRAEDPTTDPAVKRRPVDRVFDFLGSTFQPLIAPMTGSAMVQVLALLLVQFKVLDAASPTAQILTATGNALFYFLPLFVAFTAAKKLGVNPYIAATVAAALLHPAFTAIGATGSVTQAFGLPLFLYSYASSMFPALLLTLALAGLDRVLKRAVPGALQQVFVPTLELLLLVPLTVLVFGPIGVLFGNAIGQGTQWLNLNAPMAFYILLPAAWIILVSMGIHWALISIAIADIAAHGTSVILGAAMGYQYAILGVALAVLVKVARDKKARTLRDTAVAATLAVAIGGITEPTIYGLVLRYRRVLVIEVITAAASGAVLGLFGTAVAGFSPAPILGLPLMQPMTGAIVALGVAVVLPIILVHFWGIESTAERAAEGTDDTDAGAEPGAEPGARPGARPEAEAALGGFQGSADGAVLSGEVEISSPLSGQVLPLSQTPDAVFASGLMGKGVTIVPSSGALLAPVTGKVVVAPSSGHAIGLRTDSGVELLIHVGIDTVKLKGEHFTLRVRQGERVTPGQVLVEFDAAAIAQAGYSLMTPVVVTNLGADQAVDLLSQDETRAGEPLLSVRSVVAETSVS